MIGCCLGIASQSMAQSFTVLPTTTPDGATTDVPVLMSRGGSSILFGRSSAGSPEWLWDIPSQSFSYATPYLGGGISTDGSTLFGEDTWQNQSFTYAPGTDVYNAIVSGATSTPTTISSNGSVVFGSQSGGAVTSMYGWSSGTLGVFADGVYTTTQPVCASQNGSVVYGMAGTSEGFVWTYGGGFVNLGAFTPTACSDDGTKVVGYNASKLPELWQSSTMSFTSLGSAAVSSVDISPDGTVVSYNTTSGSAVLYSVTGGTSETYATSQVYATSNNRFMGEYKGAVGYYQVGYTDGNGLNPGFVPLSSVLGTYVSNGALTISNLANMTFNSIIGMSTDGTQITGGFKVGTAQSYFYADIPLTTVAVPATYSSGNYNATTGPVTFSLVTTAENYYGASVVQTLAQLQSQLKYGTLTSNGGGSYTYTPSSTLTQTTGSLDSFTYNLTNPLGGASNTTTVQIYDNVFALSLSPSTGNGQTASVTGGQSVAGTLSLFPYTKKSPTPQYVYLTGTSGLTFSVSSPQELSTSGQTIPFTITTPEVNVPTTATVTASISTTAGKASAFNYTETATITLLPPTVSTLTFSPVLFKAGGTTTGTVTLSQKIPSNGTSIPVSLTYSSGLSGPASVSVAAGSQTATVPVTFSSTSPTTQQKVTASTSYTLSGKTVTTTVSQSIAVDGLQAITGLTSNLASVTGGTSITGTVSLVAPAQYSAGSTVNIASTGPVTVPASATVLLGQSSANFTIGTTPVSTDTPATVTVSNSYDSKTINLTVLAPVVTGFTINPTSVTEGGSAQGTVTISGPAPAAGFSVPITYSADTSGSAASVPAGQTTSAPFTINTSYISATTTETLTATTGSTTKQATLQIVVPTVTGLSLNPTSVSEGSPTQGTVTLDTAAGPNGLSVSMTYSADTSGPATVTVQSGQTSSAPFTINTSYVSATTTETLMATTGATTQQASLTITAPYVTALSIAPASVIEGGSVMGTVTINSAAPVNGLSVAMTYSANTTGPATVTIPAGQTSSAQFAISTTDIAGSATQTVSAASGGQSASGTVTILTPVVSKISPQSRLNTDALAFTLNVTGSNFPAGSQIVFNGTPETTTYNSSTSLSAPNLSTYMMTAATVQVQVMDPSGNLSNGLPFVITGTNNPVPTILSISPSSGPANQSFTMTVNGTGYLPVSVVKLNGTSLATTYVSATQVTADVPASLIPYDGNDYAITVTNPAPGGGTSAAVNFTTVGSFHLAVLYPNTVTVGSGNTALKCTGELFQPGATVQLGGVSLATTFVSAQEVDAVIPASLLTKVRNTIVVVVNPGNVVSNSRNFYIVAPNN